MFPGYSDKSSVFLSCSVGRSGPPQPTGCPQHKEIPLAQTSFSSHGWSLSQNTPTSCKCSFLFFPLSPQIFHLSSELFLPVYVSLSMSELFDLKILFASNSGALAGVHESTTPILRQELTSLSYMHGQRRSY